MFKNMFKQSLGPDKSGDISMSPDMAASLAYDAAVAATAVCYYKAYHQDPMIAQLQSILPINSSIFPA
jgi:hypothetical protein